MQLEMEKGFTTDEDAIFVSKVIPDTGNPFELPTGLESTGKDTFKSTPNAIIYDGIIEPNITENNSFITDQPPKTPIVLQEDTVDAEVSPEADTIAINYNLNHDSEVRGVEVGSWGNRTPFREEVPVQSVKPAGAPGELLSLTNADGTRSENYQGVYDAILAFRESNPARYQEMRQFLPFIMQKLQPDISVAQPPLRESALSPLAEPFSGKTIPDNNGVEENFMRFCKEEGVELQDYAALYSVILAYQKTNPSKFKELEPLLGYLETQVSEMHTPKLRKTETMILSDSQ